MSEDPQPHDEKGYNFIIIGGGASGSALAAQLQKKGSTLLIERGLHEDSIPESQTVSGWPKILATSASENIETKDGVWTIAPQVLGGGTSLNVGVWVRETEDYFNGLNVKIPYSEAVASYKRLESQLVSENTQSKFAGSYKSALEKEGGYQDGGLSLQRENDKTNFTYSIFTQPDENGQRFRRPACDLIDLTHPNFKLLTRFRVNKILFDEKKKPPKAIGVEIQDLRHPLRLPQRMLLAPDGELFLCAGAIHSPTVLLLSGIGPADHLKEKLVKVVVDNPDVGLGLKDKPVNPVSIFTKEKLPQCMVETIANSNKTGAAYACTSGGDIISVTASVSVALFPPGQRNEIFRPIIKFVFDLLPSVTKFIDTSYQLIAFNSEPRSTGHVRLRTNIPGDKPDVELNYFKDPEDLNTQINRVRLLHKMINGPDLKPYALNREETCEIIRAIDKHLREKYEKHEPNNEFPSDEVISYPPFPIDMNDDEAIKKWILKTYVASYHNGGSCSRVVDENFKLKGVQGLKIVDASVLAKLPRTHMQATLMMLGDFVGNRVKKPSVPSIPTRDPRRANRILGISFIVAALVAIAFIVVFVIYYLKSL